VTQKKCPHRLHSVRDEGIFVSSPRDTLTHLEAEELTVGEIQCIKEQFV
jgi:hypothetical protein